MPPTIKRNWHYLIFPLIAALCGALAVIFVVHEPNGYTGSMTFLLLLILIGAISILLILFGLFALAAKPDKKIAASIFLAAFMLPIGYFAGAAIAKSLQLGAYREEPMISLIPDIGNKVIFKKDVSEETISKFWDETIAVKRPDGRGREHLPGIKVIARVGPEGGHEMLMISYFPDVTEEQISYIREKIKASPVVEEYLENVDTSPQTPPPPASLPNAPDSKKSVNKAEANRLKQN